MALTKEQKNLVDTTIVSILKNLSENNITVRQLTREVMEETHIYMYNPGITIDASLSRISKYMSICRKWGTIYYKVDGIVINHNPCFKKDKNIVYLECGENESLYYDFIKKDFNIENLKHRVFEANNTILFQKKNLFDYEWLFNYTDNLSVINDILTYIPKEFYEKMPAGLYEEIKNNNGVLDVALFKNFYLKQKYGKYNKIAESILEYRDAGTAEELNLFLEYYSFNDLIKMFKNSLFDGDIEDWYSIRKFIKDYADLKNNGFEVIFDTNRSIEYNNDILEDIKNAEKNIILEKTLQKINFINNYEYKDYIIKVPQNQTEKRAEGKMQNNCVGYFYDDSIIRGENYIYFIRKKDTPNKSYITCRFSNYQQRTAEAKMVNNQTIPQSEEAVFELMDIIDNLIIQNLTQ